MSVTKPAKRGKFFSIESVSSKSHIVRFDGIKTGWQQWVMLSSDRHHDNALTNWELERKHLDKAKERNALIIDAGDMFCAMQGKYDPRSSMDSLRPEHKRDDYLDALIETALDFYKPYAANFALVGRGNHEANIRARHGVDLTERFVGELRKHGSGAMSGEYSGWVTFRFEIHKTVRTVRHLHYFHGAGGGGPVTRGVISSNRMAVNYPDADIVLSGHTHDQWVVSVKRERITQEGVPYMDLAFHVRTPTYKDEYQTGSGWAIEKGHNPKPLGCVWVRFFYEASVKDKGRVLMDVTAEVE